MSFLYFAYGSNMLSSRLIARCPSARVIGTAIAANHVLEFSKMSNDGSGKATLVSQSSAIHTPGVLFEIDAGERDALDKFEGAGKGYDRTDEFSVTMNEETVNATTYLASATQSDLLPFDWYLAVVIAGALEHELGGDHHNLLLAIARVIDEDVTRKTRTAALKALADHGHRDHMTLLKR